MPATKRDRVSRTQSDFPPTTTTTQPHLTQYIKHASYHCNRTTPTHSPSIRLTLIIICNHACYDAVLFTLCVHAFAAVATIRAFLKRTRKLLHIQHVRRKEANDTAALIQAESSGPNARCRDTKTPRYVLPTCAEEQGRQEMGRAGRAGASNYDMNHLDGRSRLQNY